MAEEKLQMELLQDRLGKFYGQAVVERYTYHPDNLPNTKWKITICSDLGASCQKRVELLTEAPVSKKQSIDIEAVLKFAWITDV